MRIHARPTLIDFTTGEAKQFVVSVVGIAPHKTYYIEQQIGYVPDKQLAPSMAGKFICTEIQQKAMQEFVAKHGMEALQNMVKQDKPLPVQIPQIPGVTVPGEWKNPRYGDREKHRLLYSMKSPKQSSRNPERFTA